MQVPLAGEAVVGSATAVAARTPRGLTLVILAWWGWRVGMPAVGLMLGLALEGARYLPSRWELQADDFRRLWNVTVLLFVGAGLYLFFSEGGWGTATELFRGPAQGVESLRSVTRMALTYVQWLPMLLFPFMLAHGCSRAGWLPWWSVSPLLHRRRRLGQELPAGVGSRGIHPTNPYLIAVCFAASASDAHPQWYFPVLALVVAWILWANRPREYGWGTWGATLLVGLGLAYAGQHGLVWVYRHVARLEAQFLSRGAGAGFSDQVVMTEIGGVGRRKLSGRIVLRVHSSPGGSPPSLLREAVFTQFRSPYWTAGRKDFQPVPPPVDQENWRLGEVGSPRDWVMILRSTRQGSVALALPAGTFEVGGLRAEAIETNRLSAARIEGALPLASYTAHFAAGSGFDAPPDAEDRDVASLRAADVAAITRLASDLGLSRLEGRQAADAVRDHFLRHFEYALYQAWPAREPSTNTSPLGEFLFQTRRGHCEYFATATTLLLRAAGIPARYVVGYSVQERRGDQFVVRGRHAHAWSLAFIDGRWEEVDNTPSSWIEAEARGWRAWEALTDWFSDGWLAFARWRQGTSPWRLYLFAVGMGVLAVMAWRELRGGRWRRGRSSVRAGAGARSVPGLDSELYQLVERLGQRVGPRPSGQPLAAWLRQVEHPPAAELPALGRLLDLHYRLRFDPRGLSAVEREELRSGVARHLQVA